MEFTLEAGPSLIPPYSPCILFWRPGTCFEPAALAAAATCRPNPPWKAAALALHPVAFAAAALAASARHPPSVE